MRPMWRAKSGKWRPCLFLTVLVLVVLVFAEAGDRKKPSKEKKHKPRAVSFRSEASNVERQVREHRRNKVWRRDARAQTAAQKAVASHQC